MTGLASQEYLAFPFKITAAGSRTHHRAEHVRALIEQVLFTHPGERVFRPEFGAGVRQLLFEPQASSLWDLTKKRLSDSLAQALHGEVDPRTLSISVEGDQEKLLIHIAYTLAALNRQEDYTFTLTSGKE